MADLKISQLPALGDNLATADKIAVVDGSASETKSLTIANLFSASSFGLLGSNAIPIAKISVTAGSIAGTAIADLGISTAKVANDAITAAKLDNNSSAQIVTSLPGSGGFTGQIAANSNDGYAASIWDGSAWQSLKAAASINTIAGDTTSIVNIAVATSGSTRTISASIDDSSAAAQFMAGPSGAAGSVSLRAITGADLPTATSSALGAIKVNGEGLRMDTGVIEIDNDVTASSAYNLVAVTSKGLVSAYRTITAADLPDGSASSKGALQVGTGLAVSSGVISVDNTATAGTYTKVTITASGLVSSGTTLTDADLPNHSAALLTSGTLAAARIGTDSVDGTKLSNSSTTIFQSIAQQGYPTAQFNGQLLFDTVSEDAFIWDGNAWQAITTLTKGSLVFGGNYNANTSKMTACTSAGLAAGLAVGSNLPTPSETTDGVYVVVDTAGTPSAPAPVVAFSPPDYILGVTNSSGSSWNEIDLSQTVAGQVASNITFTPYGQLSSTNVQDAMQELETEKLAKSGGTVTGEILIGNSGSLVYEGATADAFETTIGVVDPTTADKTINFPDQSGTVLVSGGASIVNADVATNAALAYSKLAALASGSILVGNGSNVATVQAVSGDATLSNAGVLTIAASAITNSKISSSAAIALSKLATGALPTAITVTNGNVVGSAAIAGTKISPDFGTQAITTTGNLTLNNQADLRLGDADGSNYTAIQAGATIGTNYTIELPTTVGATGKVLKSTVSGQVATLTWEDDASNTAASALTGNTLASGVTASSLTSVGTLSGLVVDGDMTLTGAANNVVWDKSDNALEFADSAKARFGASNDLEIYHSGSESFIADEGTGGITISSGTLSFKNQARDETYATMQVNGAVTLYHDNSTRLTTNTAGVEIGGNLSTASANNFVINAGGTSGTAANFLARCGSENAIVANANGSVDLYHDNVKRLETQTDGIKITAGEGEEANITFFADEGDNASDKFRLRTEDSGGFSIESYDGSSWETNLKTVLNGNVELYYDNDRKFRTSSTGGVIETTTGDTYLVIKAEENNSSSDALLRLQTTHVDAVAGIQFGDLDDSDIGKILYRNNTNKFEFITNTSVALILDSSQNATFTGTVSDSKGDLRKIPINAQTAAYTLVLADAGKCITQTHSGGVNCPYNKFSAGDAIKIINHSGSDIDIVQGANNTMYNAADGSTGNKTLAARGVCTVFYQAHNLCYLSGTGLS